MPGHPSRPLSHSLYSPTKNRSEAATGLGALLVLIAGALFQFSGAVDRMGYPS
jgi:hypothetical protein